MRILLVEDDPMIGKTLQQALQLDGYAVDWVTDGQAGRLAIDTSGDAYALVLLDLGLPKRSGLELLKDIRRAGNKVRVLIVTARDAVADRVAGLDAGADDYLTKPFSLEELVARVRAILRRAGDLEETTHLSFEDLEMNDEAHEVRRGGTRVELTATEYKLLRYLLMNAGRVVSKAQILDHVWNYDFGGDGNVVETYISYLRRKLDGLGPPLIHTVRGVGYSLRAPED